jgi:hypothetical protein
MYSYRAYGLGVHCNFPLPEFIPADVPSDVNVRVDSREAPPEMLEEERHIELRDDQAVLAFKHAGVFRVSAGREVIISAAPGADLSVIRLYLVGKVFATLLYQRGLLVLHASSVEVDGRTVAFMGTSYFGKSSIAASMVKCGHRLVADDVTAVDMGDGRPLAIPGYPQVKLDPEVGRLLGYDTRSLVPLHPLESRRGLRLMNDFAETPAELGLIYLLTRESGRSKTIGPQDALIELVRHTFPARLLKSGGAPHLRQCVTLAKQVPILRLGRDESRKPPKDLSCRVRDDLAAFLAATREPVHAGA